MRVPFLDLKAQYNSIKDEINPEINWVLDNTSFVLGEKVKSFEENFASYCNKKHCIAVNSGTSALHLALIASGIKEGDVVLELDDEQHFELYTYAKSKGLDFVETLCAR